MSTPRTWSAFARRADNGGFSGTCIGIPEDRIGFAGLDTRVTVTEDPSGDYLGWIKTGHEDEPPIMIEHQRIFNIQFPSGFQASVDAGNGTVVRVSITAI